MEVPLHANPSEKRAALAPRRANRHRPGSRTKGVAILVEGHASYDAGLGVGCHTFTG